MSKPSQSKKTGSTQWLLVRISGVVLLVLLLGHFWVQHFFIEDFYGMMNIIDRQPGVQQVLIPFLAEGEDKLLAPVRSELHGTDHFLNADRVNGPTTITLVRKKRHTDILRGDVRDRDRLRDLLGYDLSREAQIETLTISPKQIKTKRMINYSDVHARVGGDSWIWWKAYNLLFLSLGLYHGLVGVWDVVLDYKMGPIVRMSLYGAILTFGVVLFIVGILIIVPM